ncbi:DUF4825 domain-containing protein [Filibacter tadaridae]|uniref:DUF4825 domain-containing protein n=2 Tax=Filibacter tadaridae TaxID=2483811 RepID=A0A3P5XEF1_9BACL|nr:DUF4825 domain-containing protein [Filibacter tadaridae]VDC26887.1 hypothetical protein FILTAD_01553 [Filibacter tadaridae]
MEKRRLVMIIIVILAIPLFIWLQFFEVPNKVKIGEAKLQQDPETHEFEKVKSYENDYMGNNSNMGNLFSELPLNKYQETFEIDSEALSLTMHYNARVDEIGKKAEQAVLYNTTAVFVLIGNMQKIEMKFEDKSYTVTRKNVEDWYGGKLDKLKKVDEFKKDVQQPLIHEDSGVWLAAYTKGN